MRHPKQYFTAALGCLLLPLSAFAQTTLPQAPATAPVPFPAPNPAQAASVPPATGFAQAPVVPMPTPVPGVPLLTRAQAEAQALKNNPRITVGHLLSLAAGQGVRVSRSGELPQVIGSITGEGGYDGSRIASGMLSSSRLLQHVGGGVDVSQLITDFGHTHNLVASSQLAVKAQQATEEATRQDVVLVVDQAFYGALRAQAVLLTAQQTVKTRQATAGQIVQLTKNNLRSTLDQSFAEVNLSQAQLLLLDAQNNMDASLAELDDVLGLDHEQQYTLVADENAAPPPPPDADALVKLALSQRPDLQALHQQSASQQKLSRAEWDENLPSLSALGTAGGTPVRPGRYYISSWDGAAALNLNVPVFTGFLYSAQAKQTHLQAQATDAQATALRNAIVRDVHTAWLNANNTYFRIHVTAQLLNQANMALVLAQTRYNLGLSSIVELSDAQLAQTQAQISYDDARFRYRDALSALRFQTGQYE